MLHIIQNDPEVPPGNICDTLDLLESPYVMCHPYRDGALPDVGEVTALIVLGGAMGVNDDARYPFLSEVKELIRQVVARQIPYLGICLGGQLLAAALGAEVISNRWEEQGTLDVALTEAGKTDPLFNGIAETFNTFQWHHDSFDLPAGCVLLASSDACPHQAFRVGKSAWGLQFHPEVTEKIIRAWCTWNRATAERAGELVADFYRKDEKYRSTAQRFLHNFLQSVSAPR